MLEFLDSNGIVGVQSELQKAEFLLKTVSVQGVWFSIAFPQTLSLEHQLYEPNVPNKLGGGNV
jgi:hypothetical protein